MRILLTGHEGYIGAVARRVFAGAGHDVVGLDTGWYVGCDLGPAPSPIPSIEKDIRDVEADDLVGFDAVAHLAAVSNDPIGELDPDTTYEINHRASVRLAEVARHAGVPRFLFSSSCSLYGAAGTDAPLDEESGFDPVTAYGHSKVLAEQDISPMADDSFSPTYLRNATVYGSSPRLRGDVVVNNLTGIAFDTGRIEMTSDGSPWRPLVHVADVANAFLAIAEAPRDLVHDEAINIGRTSENYRIRDVASIVESALPGSTVSFAAGAGADKRDYRVDCSKLERLLPHATPSRTVADGVRELLEDYRRFGVTLDQINGRQFTRLRRIDELMAEGRLDEKLRWRAAVAA